MAIEDFLGIPYRLNGRDRSGTDCLGLVLMYQRSLGMNPPDGDGQPIGPNWREDAEQRMKAWFAKHATPVTTPAVGDIAVFRLPFGTMHLGVMVDGDRMLHVLEDRPSSLTSLRRCRRRAVIYRLKPAIDSRQDAKGPRTT